MSRLIDNLVLVPPHDSEVVMSNGEKEIIQHQGYVCKIENGIMQVVTNLEQDELYELVEYCKNLQKMKNML